MRNRAPRQEIDRRDIVFHTGLASQLHDDGIRSSVCCAQDGAGPFAVAEFYRDLARRNFLCDVNKGRYSRRLLIKLNRRLAGGELPCVAVCGMRLNEECD
jgi:hypothetical protein